MRIRTLVSGAALAVATAVPMASLTTAPADAAPMKTWNRLAQCESGGKWHINTGNGYYGGLQISPSTWEGFGGKKFANLPHNATKKQQIRVAEKIQNAQGWGAWPACSDKLGLG